jgi:hypothetical protein
VFGANGSDEVGRPFQGVRFFLRSLHDGEGVTTTWGTSLVPPPDGSGYEEIVFYTWFCCCRVNMTMCRRGGMSECFRNHEWPESWRTGNV